MRRDLETKERKDHSSVRCVDRAQQLARAIPENLNANTDQQERRQSHDDAHPSGTYDCRDAIREAVTEINTKSEQGRTDQEHDDVQIDWAAMARGIGTQCNRNRNRAGTHRQRQREWIKSAAKNIARIDIVMNLTARIVVVVFLLEHVPSGDDYDQAPAYLDNRQRDSEERENMRANQTGNDQQDKTIERDALREKPTGCGRIIARQREKNGAAAQRVDDGEKRAEKEDCSLDRFEQQRCLREEEYSRILRNNDRPVRYRFALLAPFGEQNLGRRDRLADVALGVVRDVNQQAAESRRQRLFANESRLLEIGFRKCANALSATR